MKKIYLPIVFLATGLIIFFIAKSQSHSPYGDGNPGCIENPNLYEERLQVMPEDIKEFVKQDSFKRYPDFPFTGECMIYDVALTRGLVDTTLFRPEHWNKFPQMSFNARYNTILSPLIIEGEVKEVLNEDTAKKKCYEFTTVFIIEVKDIIASKYQIKKGEYVTARTNLYGYRYSPYTKEVNYQFAGDIEPYQKGKTYLFVLDKFYYMEQLNQMLSHPSANGFKDEYCPYTFALSGIEHYLSKEYENKKLTKQDIRAFLKK